MPFHGIAGKPSSINKRFTKVHKGENMHLRKTSATNRTLLEESQNTMETEQAMPSVTQKYGKDYKSIAVVLTPAEHVAYKVKAAEYGIPMSDVCRLALEKENLWKEAKRLRAKANKANP